MAFHCTKMSRWEKKHHTFLKTLSKTKHKILWNILKYLINALLRHDTNSRSPFCCIKMCIRFIDLIHSEIHYCSIMRWIKLITQCDVSQHSARQSTGKQFAFELALCLLTFIIIIYKPCQRVLHRACILTFSVSFHFRVYQLIYIMYKEFNYKFIFKNWL